MNKSVEQALAVLVLEARNALFREVCEYEERALFFDGIIRKDKTPVTIKKVRKRLNVLDRALAHLKITDDLV